MSDDKVTDSKGPIPNTSEGQGNVNPEGKTTKGPITRLRNKHKAPESPIRKKLVASGVVGQKVKEHRDHQLAVHSTPSQPTQTNSTRRLAASGQPKVKDKKGKIERRLKRAKENPEETSFDSSDYETSAEP